MGTFSDLWQFVTALVMYWQAYLTGGVVIAGLTVYSLLSGKSIPKRAAILGICFFFGMASFMAWRDQHDALLSLQHRLRTPTISGEVTGIMSALHEFGSRKIHVIFTSLTIENPHGPPTGLINWKMGIKGPEGRTVWGNAMPLSEKNQYGPIGRGLPEIAFQNARYMPDQTLKPVGAGEAVGGWFWSVFSGSEVEGAYKGRHKLVIEFSDAVSGKTHELEKRFPPPGMHMEGWGIPK